MLDETTVLKLSDKVSFQQVGDGAVILMIDSGQLYTANGSTEAFLSRVDGERALGPIIDSLLGEYDIDRETLAADMTELADQLIAESVLVRAA
jgi:hypothetical protein